MELKNLKFTPTFRASLEAEEHINTARESKGLPPVPLNLSTLNNQIIYLWRVLILSNPTLQMSLDEFVEALDNAENAQYLFGLLPKGTKKN
jgi:hypothetical protein